ncbi:hypothetical protein G9C85_04305 [Halorubellus sp. JP-L1]|uniref:hypothetical protein n=1 Tax=Halorubellus sp. JP-L1 TaxID=2715753 RepID=UPI00140A8213|nr:hypothetical protein [Halorubellus sp. JP-L1]NHN40856.1 hypothetical protein [Halorubellus sp. JP-L1]
MSTDPPTADEPGASADGERADAAVLGGLLADLLVQDADRNERALDSDLHDDVTVVDGNEPTYPAGSEGER